MSVGIPSAHLWRRAAAVTVFAMLWPIARPLESQVPGFVRGRIVNEFQRPLAQARVAVVGTGIVGVTDTLGTFRIANVPSGPRTLQISMIGYAASRLAVRIESGDTVVVDVRLLRDRTGRDSIRITTPATPLDSTLIRRPAPRGAIVRDRQVNVALSRPRIGSVIPLQLFDDFAVNVVVRQVVPYRETGFRLSGEVFTESGTERGIASLILMAGRLTGNVRIGEVLYVVRAQPGGIHTITEVAPERLPPDTIDTPRPPPRRVPPPESNGSGPSVTPGADALTDGVTEGVTEAPVDLFADARRARARDPLTCSDRLDATVGRVPEIRVLAGYTTAARDARGPDLEEEIAIAVSETADILRESGIRVDLSLVALRHIASDELNAGATEKMDIWLDRLLAPATNPLVADFVTARDDVAADIAILVTQRDPAGGLAYPMRWARHGFADSAYAVVTTDGMNLRLSLAHEVGHLLGGMHQSFGAPAASTGPAHSLPFRCIDCSAPSNGTINKYPDGAGWVTVMGLPGYGLTSISRGIYYTEIRIPRFSNPDAEFNDRAAGVPSGAMGAADHRSTFLHAAATVAAFRMTPVWFVSASAASPWAERMVTADWRGEVRFAQLDAGGMADAFRVDEETGEWWWAKDTRAPWAKLRVAQAGPVVPLASIRFADFNGDGIDDAFWMGASNKTWHVSWGARSAAQSLNTTAAASGRPIEELAFGRFDAGSTTADVLWADPETGEWWVSSSGTGAWVAFAPAAESRRLPIAALRFGDFDTDGRTDIFHARSISGEVTWRVHDLALGKWRNVQAPSHVLSSDVENIAVGEFDGIPGADVLVTNGTQWLLSSGGTAPLREVMASCHVLAGLAIADVDGDGVLDVLRAGTRP